MERPSQGWGRMIRQLFSKRFHVPARLVGLRAQASILAICGATWLAVVLMLLGAGKAMGEYSLGWWVIYFVLPLPLTIWCACFLAIQWRELVRGDALDGLFFAAGLIGGALPVLAFLFMCGSSR
jgi:hypothetical protein